MTHTDIKTRNFTPVRPGQIRVSSTRLKTGFQAMDPADLARASYEIIEEGDLFVVIGQTTLELPRAHALGLLKTFWLLWHAGRFLVTIDEWVEWLSEEL